MNNSDVQRQAENQRPTPNGFFNDARYRTSTPHLSNEQARSPMEDAKGNLVENFYGPLQRGDNRNPGLRTYYLDYLYEGAKHRVSLMYYNELLEAAALNAEYYPAFIVIGFGKLGD